ncbi:MAG TPA: aminomethyl-transferring glycine dehydrogenase subunit GcvPA [Rhizobiales bacterium]|nr:aminomethyl-transferring glycine dehydrogenase subunit GcvPA [Hyphomicrobiales bacterium]
MRYLPLTDADRQSILAAIGVQNIGDLFADIPEEVRLKDLVELPRRAGEMDVERQLGAMAARNTPASSAPFFVGCGAYKHHVPASVDHLIQRSEFLTSYTPYQPEISQGTLQYLFEFQTQVALLTGMEVANASMYDGSTACGEAVLMAHRLTRRSKAVLSGGLHPQYRNVVEMLSDLTEFPLNALAADPAGSEDLIAAIDDETACVVVQSPDVFGRVRDLSAIAAAAHEKGALLIAVVTEVISLGALKPPGEMGADIVVAEGQSIGVGLNFGGPHVGLLATQQKHIRQLPGRICGETVDANGKRGFVLTLSTREQHIRREKATSNICTNSGLCALAFSIHLSLLGETGLMRLARINHANAVALADALSGIAGVELLTPEFFNEFTIRVPGQGIETIEALARKGVLGGVPAARLAPDQTGLDDLIIVAATEVNSSADRDAYVKALQEVLS